MRRIVGIISRNRHSSPLARATDNPMELFVGAPLAVTDEAEISVARALGQGAQKPAEQVEAVQALARATRLWATRRFRPQRLAVAVCPDREGVISALTEAVFHHVYNLEGSSADTVAGYLVFLAQVAPCGDSRGDDEWADVEGGLDKAASRLFGTAQLVRVGPVEQLWPRPGSFLARFEAVVPDCSGALAAFTKVVWEAGYPLDSITTVVREIGDRSECLIDAHIGLHDAPWNREAEAISNLESRLRSALTALVAKVHPEVDTVEVRSQAVTEIQPPQWGIPRPAPTSVSRLVVTGLAQPGFVHQAMQVVHELQGNIIGSAMSVLEGRTALLLIVEGGAVDGADLADEVRRRYRENDEWKRLGALGREWDATVEFLQELGEPSERDESPNCFVRAHTPDEPGALYYLSNKIKQQHGNIVRLRTMLSGEGTTTMRLHVHLPAEGQGLDAAKAGLTQALAAVAHEHGWDPITVE